MRIVILTPVYQDWVAFQQLVRELDREIAAAPEFSNIAFSVLAVDDGSTVPMDVNRAKMPTLNAIRDVRVLSLVTNLGHQRAIALGAALIVRDGQADAVLVMDADGEDRPSDTLRLVEAHLRNRHCVILAQRAKRSESASFRFGYWVYRRLIRLLAGRDLPFGNFSLVPMPVLRRLVSGSDIWNHYAAAIGRAGLPMELLSTDRGQRYAGKGQMTWTSLIVHGMSAISVFSDRVAVRLIIASLSIFFFSMLAMLAVAAIRFLTELAIPGWASQVFGTLILASLFSVGFASLLAFVTLHSRRAVDFVPLADGDRYISEVKEWPLRQAQNTSALS